MSLDVKKDRETMADIASGLVCNTFTAKAPSQYVIRA
jgi:hypothetical protein